MERPRGRLNRPGPPASPLVNLRGVRFEGGAAINIAALVRLFHITEGLDNPDRLGTCADIPIGIEDEPREKAPLGWRG
jgi:hypothetical protein